MEAFVRELWSKQVGRLVAHARTYGEVNPVGDGDSKTCVPSTYRPVGTTCPTGGEYLGECKFLHNGCYAEMGNVGIHQRRSKDDLSASARSVAVGMVWAVKVGTLCRLHVSGDFCNGDRIDHAYVVQVGILADMVNSLAGRRSGTPIAWSYTHIPQKLFAPYQRYLARKGVIVRVSDFNGHMGAVVAPFDRLHEMKEKGVKYLKCPAQLPQGKTCASCTLCWTLPAHTVVFDPHGPGRKKVLNVINDRRM